MPKKMKNKTKTVVVEIKSDPTDPAIVLLGLIFVNLGPPNVLPNKYPPMSENIQPKRMINKINFNWALKEKNKNK